MALMVPAQKFYSYKDGHDSDGGQVVDILSSLCLTTPDGHKFPDLPIRMVPGQVDDILLSASDLDKWGYDSHTDPDYFHFHTVGLAVPRETPVPAHNRSAFIRGSHHTDAGDELADGGAECIDGLPSDTFVYMRGVTILGPYEIKSVDIPFDPNLPTSAWFEGAVNSSYSFASGPIDLDGRSKAILVKNNTDESLEIPVGIRAGCIAEPSEENQVLSESFEVLDQEEFLEVAEHSTITPSAAVGTLRVSAPLGSDRVRQQSVSPLVSKWLKLCCLLSGLTMPAIHTLRRTSPTLEPPSDIGATPVEFIWSDLKSEAYKGALLSKFDEYRDDRYSHLNGKQFALIALS